MKVKSIKIPRWLVTFVLWVFQGIADNKVCVVCRGYNEDSENYTGIYWGDEIDIDDYMDYQLWITYSPLNLKS